MQVKLVSYTKAVDGLLNDVDNDVLALIAYVARVSNPSNQHNHNTSANLIKYLIDNRHWSPFEMADVTLEITTTRDIARQILRHRSFSFQEFSQRYADPTQNLGFIYREARMQDLKNRQNSLETTDTKLNLEWVYKQEEALNSAREAYQWAMNNGIAKEVARAVLPEGITESRIYMKGSIRSWIHYIEVRTDPTTQKEHREVAEACAKEIFKVFPLILEK